MTVESRRGGWDTRRVLLGDWSRGVRDGIDLLRLALGVGAVGFAVAGDPAAAWLLGFLGALTLLARLVNLPRVYDLCFTAAMVLQGYGEALGVYDEVRAFDDLVHFTLPMLTAPVLFIALARLDVVPDPRDDTTTRHYVGIFVVALALGITLGALWELVEWGADAWFGTHLQLSNDDTVGDVLRDSLGSVAGAVLLVAWARYGWGSVRRIPGVNTEEEIDA
jgi:hypothetical protein